jgi:hypothetical protein
MRNLVVKFGKGFGKVKTT